MRMLRGLILAAAAVVVMGAASADPAERLADPAQEARARALFREVRCLVCQNESIDDSGADLAEDLRKVVRQQIAQGRSDAQVRAFLTDRYGEFVLFKPRFSAGNAALWLTPFAIVGVGGALLLAFRRRSPALEAPLTEDEAERLSVVTHSDPVATVPPHAGPTNAP
ncbi:MAG: cytochrome c-type biogenesis protein CcmH [Caulobacterales bacterium 32-69-10]|nr:MAG: cytochrome c-type biogenesis protein CcmH [Caulobacterales bacterium 32-69-10]